MAIRGFGNRTSPVDTADEIKSIDNVRVMKNFLFLMRTMFSNQRKTRERETLRNAVSAGSAAPARNTISREMSCAKSAAKRCIRTKCCNYQYKLYISYKRSLGVIAHGALAR